MSSLKPYRLGLLVPACAVVALAAVLTVSLASFPLWLALSEIAILLLTCHRRESAFILLLAVISLDVAQPTIRNIVVTSSELQFAVFALAWIISRYWRNDWGSVDWRPLKWSAPFVMVLLFSCANSLEFEKVLPHVVRRSELFVAFFLTLNTVVTSQARRWVLNSVGFLSIAHVGLATLQLGLTDLSRTFTFFTNPNQLGGYFGLLLPLTLAIWLSASPERPNYHWGLVPAALFVGVVFTQSRAALLSVTTAGIFVFFKTANPLSLVGLKRLVALAVLLPVLLIFVGAVFHFSSSQSSEPFLTRFYSIEGRFRTVFIKDAYRARLTRIKAGLEVWRGHPFLGRGPARVEDASANDDESAGEQPNVTDPLAGNATPESRVNTHNLYVQLGVEHGLLGLLSFLFFLGSVWVSLWRMRRPSGLAAGGLGLILGLLVHSFFDVTFPSLALEIGLLLGISSTVPRSESS